MVEYNLIQDVSIIIIKYLVNVYNKKDTPSEYRTGVYGREVMNTRTGYKGLVYGGFKHLTFDIFRMISEALSKIFKKPEYSKTRHLFLRSLNKPFCNLIYVEDNKIYNKKLIGTL